MEVNPEKLLNLIKVRSPIYHCQDHKYSNRYAIEQLWIEISIEMGCDVLDCKKKWASLRNAYARYLRQERDGQLRSKWRLAEAISFLRDHIHLHPSNRHSLYSHNPHARKVADPDSWSEVNDNTQNNSSMSSTRNSPIQSEKSVNLVPKFEIEEDGEEEAEYEEEPAVEYVEQHPTTIEKPAFKKMILSVPELREESAATEYVQREARVKPRESGNSLFFKCLLMDYERLSTKRQRTFRLYMLSKMNELQEDEENEVLNASTASTVESMVNFKL